MDDSPIRFVVGFIAAFLGLCIGAVILTYQLDQNACLNRAKHTTGITTEYRDWQCYVTENGRTLPYDKWVYTNE